MSHARKFEVSVFHQPNVMSLVPLALTAVALLSPRAQTRKVPTKPLTTLSIGPDVAKGTGVDVEGASKVIRTLLTQARGQPWVGDASRCNIDRHLRRSVVVI